MTHPTSGAPTFVAEAERPLTWEERALVELVVRHDFPQAMASVPKLRVVGRCGCGQCPTVFFRAPGDTKYESQVGAYTGTDDDDGVTGVALWQADGRLALLEFWSVDGHEPCSAPSMATLKKV